LTDRNSGTRGCGWRTWPWYMAVPVLCHHDKASRGQASLHTANCITHRTDPTQLCAKSYYSFVGCSTLCRYMWYLSAFTNLAGQTFRCANHLGSVRHLSRCPHFQHVDPNAPPLAAPCPCPAVEALAVKPDSLVRPLPSSSYVPLAYTLVCCYYLAIPRCRGITAHASRLF
jgi:hypothetical protein